MRRNTKEIILQEALTLFSTRGYEAVGVREIAKAVGIKESSIYKHYKNKQDIFECIFEEMKNRYAQIEDALGMPVGDNENIVEQYKTIEETKLLYLAENLFLFFMKDDFAGKFRKMLTVEQYRSPLAGRTYREYFLQAPIAYQSALFKGLMEQGVFVKADPDTAAMHFFAPIFMLMIKYDNSLDQLEEGLKELKQHIVEFTKRYSTAK